MELCVLWRRVRMNCLQSGCSLPTTQALVALSAFEITVASKWNTFSEMGETKSFLSISTLNNSMTNYKQNLLRSHITLIERP